MDIKDLQDVPPWDWPEDAGDCFLQILRKRSAAPSERLLAAELAGDLTVINDRLADALIAIVRNPAEPVDLRAMAAIAFGPAFERAHIEEFEEPESVPISEAAFHRLRQELKAVYDDPSTPKEVRRRAFEGSVRAPQPWHTGAIRAAYTSGDPEWVLTAVFGMRFVSGFDAEVLASIDHPDPETHLEAIGAAGAWALEAAWPHVCGLLLKPGTPKLLLLAAIRSAPYIQPAEAADILMSLSVSPDEEIADAANDGLLELAGFEGGDDEDEEEESGEGKWIN